MLFANVRRLFLPVLGAQSHIVPGIVTGTPLARACCEMPIFLPWLG
jgi:hypothetical protein